MYLQRSSSNISVCKDASGPISNSVRVSLSWYVRNKPPSSAGNCLPHFQDPQAFYRSVWSLFAQALKNRFTILSPLEKNDSEHWSQG